MANHIIIPKQYFLLIILFAFTSITAIAQESADFPPPEIPVEVKAKKAMRQITIDGNLAEEDWQNAEVISDFFRVEPKQGGEYKYKTEVRVLFDEKNLYIGAFCKDSLGKKGVRVQDLRRDFAFGENDIFAVQLDAQNTKQYAVSFQTTPYGNQRDLQIFNGSKKDNDWNALWNVKTQITDDGYYAEFAIPFKTLRYNTPVAGEQQSWGITFFRLARREYEQTYFPKIPQAFGPFRMTYAAQLTGIEPPPPSTNLQVTPYALYNYDQTKAGDVETKGISEPKFGADIKWAVTPNSVVDLTVNTDFAQADVDRAVVNLERFNIFFPERRQFFLENSGIWSGSDSRFIKPFFSRRVGLQGNFNAAPAPIDAGARFTNKTEQRTIGALYVKQRATDFSPDTHFGVARYTQNYSKENNVGVMLTHQLDEQNSNLSLAEQNNSTVTLDGIIRPSSSLNLQYMASTSMGENDNGYAGTVKVGHSNNNHYLGFVGNVVSENYDPTMGFVFQKDVMHYSPGGYAILRPKKLPFVRRWDPGVFIDYYHDLKDFGNFQQASAYIFPVYFFFKDNSFFEASLTPTWQNINFDFAPLGIEITKDDYFYTTYNLEYRTDGSKKLSAKADYFFGDFYNGKKQTLKSSARFAPIPQVAFSTEYEYNSLKELGANKEDLKTNLYSAGLRLALNPKVQLQSFYQYNDFNEKGRINSRFSWEYSPQSFIYLVYNNTEDQLLTPHQQQNQFISKINFVKQF